MTCLMAGVLASWKLEHDHKLPTFIDSSKTIQKAIPIAVGIAFVMPEMALTSSATRPSQTSSSE